MSTSPWWLKATDSCGVAYPRMFSNHFPATAEGFALRHIQYWRFEVVQGFPVITESVFSWQKIGGEKWLQTKNHLLNCQKHRQKSKYFKFWYYSEILSVVTCPVTENHIELNIKITFSWIEGSQPLECGPALGQWGGPSRTWQKHKKK